MPYAAGVYGAPSNSWNPAVAGSAINATDWAALLADLTTALSTCVLKDGTQTMTANLPMGGFKLTGLGAGSALTDSASIIQVQNQTGSFLTGTAGTNTITATATPTPAYTIGQRFTFLPANTNTGATTLNISSLGAGAVQWGGAALVGGELVASVPVTVLVTAVTPVFEIIPAAVSSASWTPVLTFATPGDLSVSYSTQTGTYVKIGKIVTAQCVIVTSAFTHTTSSGNLEITGLPFAVNAGANFWGSMIWQGITKANYTHMTPEAAAGASQLLVFASGSGQNNAAITSSEMPSAGSVILGITITYET